MDQRVLSHYSDARNVITAADLGGSGTGSYAITTANISNLFTVGARKLDAQDVPSGERVAVIGNRLLETLRLYVGARETGFGETVSDNGLIGRRFGFDIVVSNNVPFSTLITFGATTSNPSDGDTFVFDGVTFTFKSSLGTTAGNILIETNAVDTMKNLANAINAGTGAGTKYVDISSINRKRLLKDSVTASTPSGTTFTITGYGDVTASENASNFAITSHTSFPIMMRRGAVDLVTQKSPSVEFRMAEKRLGRYVYPWINNLVNRLVVQVKSLLIYGETLVVGNALQAA